MKSKAGTDRGRNRQDGPSRCGTPLGKGERTAGVTTRVRLARQEHLGAELAGSTAYLLRAGLAMPGAAERVGRFAKRARRRSWCCWAAAASGATAKR
jgi:hypothetical protein